MNLYLRDRLEGWLGRPTRAAGFSISDERAVGVMVRRPAGGKLVAHMLERPEEHRGWAAVMEPVRFFARRTVIPKEFSGRESEYVRYNYPDLIPLQEAHSILLRFERAGDSGETLLHGIRENRLEEFLADRRRDSRMPRLTGVVPPASAFAAAIRAARPSLSGKLIAVLVGGRTTRYLGLKDGRVVSVFDDVHRPDLRNAHLKFKKTIQRVMWYMESEGLGGLPDRLLVMGDPTVRSWLEDVSKQFEGVRMEYADLPAELGLRLPSGIAPEPAILALGAAICSMDDAKSELNFIGVPKAVAARRFDAYDLVIYGSVAAMLALSFVTLNAVTATRVRALKEELQANTRRIQSLREEVDAKRGLAPVSEKLVSYSERRFSNTDLAGRQVMDALPDFLTVIAESVPDGVRLDRVGSGAAEPGEEPNRSYRSILPKSAGLDQVALIGETRFPEKAMRWVEILSRRLGQPVTMEEMKSDGAAGYRFRIVVGSKGEARRA